MIGSLLNEVISSLSQGLQNDVARTRLDRGLRYINGMDGKIYDSKLVNKVVMPVFTYGVHKGHRYDIPPNTYARFILDMMLGELVPTSDKSLVLRNGQRMSYSLDNDEEADYLERFYLRVRDKIEQVMPES